MEYHEEFIIDFAKRTRANLEFVESAEAKGFEVYEVTQLCNSLLGLLVFPREDAMTQIPHIELDQLVAEGWPRVSATYGKLKRDTLCGLVDYMRHGVAHCNIQFIGTEGRIEKVRIWNVDPGKAGEPKVWEAEIPIADLRTFAIKFIELLEEPRATK